MSDGKSKTQTFFLSKNVVNEELTRFTQQLATLLNSGVSLSESLDLLGKAEIFPKIHSAVAGLAQAARSGRLLNEAMQLYPSVFDENYRNMVRAGELSGDLGRILANIGRFREKMARAKSKTISALTYPILVTIVALGIIFFLAMYLVPRFEQLLISTNKNATLPALTRWVTSACCFLRDHFCWFFIALCLLGALVILLQQNHRFRIKFSQWQLKIPVIGGLIFRQNLAIFVRNLGILLDNNVPFVEALRLAANGMQHPALQEFMFSCVRRVREGELFSETLRSSYVQMSLIRALVEVGEATGKLSETLLSASEQLEQELDRAIERASSLLQPVIVLCLAGVVSVIAVAMFLPLTQLLQSAL